MTGLCAKCGLDYSVPSYRGSKLSSYTSPCCGVSMKAPPSKPRGLPYVLWRGDYAEREDIVRRWKNGEWIEHRDNDTCTPYTRESVLRAGGEVIKVPDGFLLRARKL